MCIKKVKITSLEYFPKLGAKIQKKFYNPIFSLIIFSGRQFLPLFQKTQEELLQRSQEFSSYGFLLRSTLIFE